MRPSQNFPLDQVIVQRCVDGQVGFNDLKKGLERASSFQKLRPSFCSVRVQGIWILCIFSRHFLSHKVGEKFTIKNQIF